MAEVKWIKIVTDVFDDEKILLIETLPDADSIIVIWFKLLCLAGKQNNGGVFLMGGRIPYTEEMFATIFRRPLNTVRLALRTFQEYGMVDIIDNTVTIPHWEKHQSLDAYEQSKEKTRQRVAAHRERQKALIESNVTGNVTQGVTDNVMRNVMSQLPSISYSSSYSISNSIEEIEGKGEEEKQPASNRIDYMAIKEMYNDLCPSFPSCVTMSEARKKAIKARFTSGYTMEDFKMLFMKAEASSFLKGHNGRNWIASFDWLIKDSNMAKVLSGNYDERQSVAAPVTQHAPKQPREKTFMEMVREMEGRGGGDML